MKRFLFAAAMLCAAVPALAADVGISISMGQPGFYGRIDIGNVPPPPLIYSAPVVIQPVPVEVVRPPIYLHVPPGHARNWRQHCYRYNACHQRVYFVQNRWYNDVYVRHHHHHSDDPGGRYDKWEQKRHDKEHRKGHGRGHHDRGDHDRGDHGRGHHRD